MYDRLDTGSPIADSIYVAGYAPNGLTDQREPVQQRFISSRPSAADNVRGAELPQASLGRIWKRLGQCRRHTGGMD
jgi:hypothetical protein